MARGMHKTCGDLQLLSCDEQLVRPVDCGERFHKQANAITDLDCRLPRLVFR